MITFPLEGGIPPAGVCVCPFAGVSGSAHRKSLLLLNCIVRLKIITVVPGESGELRKCQTVQLESLLSQNL